MISKEKFCEIANDIIELNKQRDALFNEAERWFNYEPFYEVVSDYIAIKALAAAVDDKNWAVYDWFSESCYGEFSVDMVDDDDERVEVSTVEELYDFITRGKI